MMTNRQFDQAAKLLKQCWNLSSQWGNPIQRLCFYFSEVLLERIERETSRNDIKKCPKSDLNLAYNFESSSSKTEFYALVAFYTRVLPYVKLLQFTSMQAIIDAVGNERYIHVIDLGIRTGCQWTVLMQYLALKSGSCLELLKITAVGMDGEELRVSGRRLAEFARSLGVPFKFRMVEISSMEEVSEGLFQVKQTEAVAVYAPIVFRSLLYKPVLLERVVNVLKNLKPWVMAITEIEADHNSPCFDNRFVEVLFYMSTYFDSIDVALPDRKDVERVKFEEVFCGNQVKNMIAFEGNDRRVRHVRTDVWRSFFRRTGLKEMGFSYQAWYQAKLLLKKFRGGECYFLEPNGTAMTIGWKETPLATVSAWTCN